MGNIKTHRGKSQKFTSDYQSFYISPERQNQPLEIFYKKVVLKNFAKFIRKHLFQSQVFSFEFCEIFKNTFFTEHLWTTASGTLFTGEWFYRPDFHQGTLRGRFSRGTETGCINWSWLRYDKSRNSRKC